MKLKSKLMILFSLTVVLAASPLASVGLYQTQKQSLQNVDSQLVGTMASASKELDGWLSSNAKIVETLGYTIQEATPQDSLNKDYFKLMHMGSNQGTLSDLYFGRESDGLFLNGADWTPDPGYDPRERPWYKQAQTQGNNQLMFTDPYQDQMTGGYAVSIAMPVHTPEGDPLGVVAGDLLLTRLTETMSNVNLNGLGYAFLLDKNGNFLTHPDESLVNTSAADYEELKPWLAEMQANSAGQAEYTYQGKDSLLFYNQVPSTGWIVGSVISTDLAYSEFYKLRNQFTLIIMATLVVVLGIAYIIARGFVNPLIRLKKLSQQMSDGDFTQRITIKGKDEVAELGTAFNLMSEQLGSLLKQVSGSAEQVHDISSELNQHTQSTKRIAEQIAVAADELAMGSSSQAESVYDGSARLSEMSDAVSSINRNVEHSVTMMQEAANAMNAGLQAVNEQVTMSSDNQRSIEGVKNSLSQLAERSQQIEVIAGMIHGISTQTNLLALNASIEAARAGESGKGFAVVAEEVRKLAEQSANAVKEIMVLLSDVQSASDQTIQDVNAAESTAERQVSGVNEMRSSFERIRHSIEGMSQQIDAVSSATKDLDANAGRIADVISGVASMSEQSAASTEEVASSTQEQFNYITSIIERSKELTEHADMLLQEVNKFKI